MKKENKSLKFIKKNYIVYTIDEQYVMEGNSYEVCKTLGIVKSTISKAVKNGSIVRKNYRIFEQEDEFKEKNLYKIFNKNGVHLFTANMKSICLMLNISEKTFKKKKISNKLIRAYYRIYEEEKDEYYIR